MESNIERFANASSTLSESNSRNFREVFCYLCSLCQMQEKYNRKGKRAAKGEEEGDEKLNAQLLYSFLFFLAKIKLFKCKRNAINNDEFRLDEVDIKVQKQAQKQRMKGLEFLVR